MKNRVVVSRRVKSKFRCTKADQENWDKYSSTGGYSPKNEAFLYAQQFVDMWKDLACDLMEPYGESRDIFFFFTCTKYSICCCVAVNQRTNKPNGHRLRFCRCTYSNLCL